MTNGQVVSFREIYSGGQLALGGLNSMPGRLIAATVLGAICLCAASIDGGQANSWVPPFYAAFVFLLVSLLLLSSARSLIEVVQRRRLRFASECVFAVGPQLSEFTRAASDLTDIARAATCLGAAVANILRLETAELRLDPSAVADFGTVSTSSTSKRHEPLELIAESKATYGPWPSSLPLVAEGVELGCLLLGRARRPLGESELAVATLLCAHMALALKNAQHHACIDQLQAEVTRQQAESESVSLRDEVRHPEHFGEIIGASAALKRILAVVERIAPSEVAVLITGETGTGKELIARAVHTLSLRRDGPLITVNCPAIPGPLAESELFGHERGAFTDAVAARAGQFELADGGTIFLDEVADLPLDIQAKLLRVLQEGELRRVGGHKPRPINVRTIAATNRDLMQLVREGRFREDLYYRLTAVEVALPPLRERHGDVPILSTYFLDQAAKMNGKELSGFTAEALAALCNHAWPGNIRQLQNVVQRAVLLCSDAIVRVSDLAEIVAQKNESPPSFGEAMRQEKRRRFLNALHQSGWNQSAAARLLGMSRSNFARMLRSLDINASRRGPRRVETPLPLHRHPSSMKRV